jgi:ATP phosphoribosyltransferase
MSDDNLVIALPSKGRLMDQSIELFGNLGFTIKKTGHERGYRGHVEEDEAIDVAFLSASEIAHELRLGRVHIGITGEDLVRENIADADEQVSFMQKLGFGHADVVVAVPTSWLDVESIGDLEEAAAQFRRTHGRRLRVATKYVNLAGRFFAEQGFASYRIVGSLGATEGAPIAGTAELIVDITSTGATLVANHLKILPDGVILRSEANLVASNTAEWSARALAARERLVRRLADFAARKAAGGTPPPA